MLIRLFEAGDRAAVIDLWRRCGLTRPWNDPEKDIARKQAMQPELFFVGIRDGAVVATAMAGYDGHRGSVYYLAVDPEAQGKGLGRRIMAHVERALEAIGCPKINVMVRSENADVAAFYQAVGYEENEVAVYGADSSPTREGYWMLRSSTVNSSARMRFGSVLASSATGSSP